MARLKTRVTKDGVLHVTSQRHRTQAANREAALARFAPTDGGLGAVALRGDVEDAVFGDARSGGPARRSRCSAVRAAERGRSGP